jgi:predicted AlkP superfamily pyrophosphatase or phosphodiesterase
MSLAEYEFNKECRERARKIASHIKACLKVGKENAIDKETIKIILSSHGVVEDDYIINDALLLLYGTDVKQGSRGNYYLREGNEQKDGDWY